MTALLTRAHLRRTHGDERDDNLALSPALRRRIQRRREGRAVSADVAADLAPAPAAWLAGIGYLSADDLLDCEHGCNGDCVTSGSDRCSFTCHGPGGPQ